MKIKAFTLIELLVVISIIALLIAILMPALRRAKEQGICSLCLHNLKNLSMAWFKYAVDNGGLLVGGHNGTGDGSHSNPRKRYAWVTDPQDERGNYISYKQASYEDKLRGIERGLLFGYVKDIDIDSYHCLADKRHKEPPPPTAKSPAWRSYSIAGCMNGTLFFSQTMEKYHPCKIYSEIKSPADKYVFVEDADPGGWNNGSWVLDLTRPVWEDPPAGWHYDKSNLGFADGHSETYWWKDERTIDMINESYWKQVARRQPDNDDLEYMQQHYGALPGPQEDKY